MDRRRVTSLIAGLVLTAGLSGCASVGDAGGGFVSTSVRSGDALIAVRTIGAGPAVILVPSVGRGGADFDPLAKAVAAAGFRAVLPEPRGTAGSTGLRSDLKLEDYGADLIAVMDSLGIDKAVVIGHAAGARDARMAIKQAPQRFTRLISLATGAGGGDRVRADINREEAARAHERAGAVGKFPDAERTAALQLLYFAPGNDASVWLGGWWPEAFAAHGAAARLTPREAWWPGRPIPSLIVEAKEDAVAPPEGEGLKAQLGQDVIVVSLPHASHAMLPEQPAAIAAVVIAYLKGQQTGLQAVIDAKVVARS